MALKYLQLCKCRLLCSKHEADSVSHRLSRRPVCRRERGGEDEACNRISKSRCSRICAVIPVLDVPLAPKLDTLAFCQIVFVYQKNPKTNNHSIRAAVGRAAGNQSNAIKFGGGRDESERVCETPPKAVKSSHAAPR